MRVLVVGDAPEALCVGGLLALDANDVVFAPTKKSLSQGVSLKTGGVEHCLEAPNLYKEALSAGLFDMVLCGVPNNMLESRRSIICPALAHDAVAIPIPSSRQCDEVLCRIAGEMFVVQSETGISVSINDQGVFVLEGTPRIQLQERKDSDSWRLDFISTALNSAGIETSVT